MLSTRMVFLLSSAVCRNKLYPLSFRMRIEYHTSTVETRDGGKCECESEFSIPFFEFVRSFLHVTEWNLWEITNVTVAVTTTKWKREKNEIWDNMEHDMKGRKSHCRVITWKMSSVFAASSSYVRACCESCGKVKECWRFIADMWNLGAKEEFKLCQIERWNVSFNLYNLPEVARYFRNI